MVLTGADGELQVQGAANGVREGSQLDAYRSSRDAIDESCLGQDRPHLYRWAA